MQLLGKSEVWELLAEIQKISYLNFVAKIAYEVQTYVKYLCSMIQ